MDMADRAQPDGMEARIAKLEAAFEHMRDDLREVKQDLRSMLKFGIAAFLTTWGGIVGLAGMLAKGFGWLS